VPTVRSVGHGERNAIVEVAWWAWVAVVAAILGMLAVDLLMHRDDHAPTIREALTWSIIWIAVSLAFGGIVWATLGHEAGASYYAGYVIEKSLSVDNLFVFALLFQFFKVPVIYQHRVLFWGVIGALVFRAIFIATGAALLSTFEWMFFLFGAFLIYSGVKLARSNEIGADPDRNPVLKFLRRHMRITDDYRGKRFFVRENGVRWATPLFAVLVVVETTDVLFAVDSIPAIFAVTTNAFIVFTSNAFAILGLRALYFLLAGVLGRFTYLKLGLAAVLVFVGIKMIVNEWWHVPIWLSLGVIVLLIGGSIVFSLYKTAADRGQAGVEPA
jgi:tellurite resistance protein TerC